MDRLTADTLKRFESLGDNCEFGFVQRANGYEEGGLLRWAISPLNNLIHCLDTDFRNFYLYENLEPSAPDMVRDTATGLAFHTDMRSLDGQFILEDAPRRAIYAKEKTKMYYLLDKFRMRLRQQDTICVYKQNVGVTDAEAFRLQAALSKFGETILLVVRSIDQHQKHGTVERSRAGFLIGYVDQFAPYSQADHISIQVWNHLIRNALE